MIKPCQERRAGRGDPRPSGLTQQGADQLAEASGIRTERRSSSPWRRCVPLKRLAFPAETRLATKQNPAAHCGKIIEYGP